MKKVNNIICIAILIVGLIACNKDKDSVLNPNIDLVEVNETWDSFYPQPTSFDRFDYIGEFLFDDVPSGIGILISWEQVPNGIYIHPNNLEGGVLVNGNGFARALDEGFVINANSTVWESSDIVISYDYVDNPSLDKGELAGQGDKYIGFYMYDYDDDTSLYYGWAKINVSEDGRTVKVIEYASQKNANTAIKTGEK